MSAANRRLLARVENPVQTHELWVEDRPSDPALNSGEPVYPFIIAIERGGEYQATRTIDLGTLVHLEGPPVITPASAADPALVDELRRQAAYAPPPDRPGQSTDTLEDTLRRIHEKIIAPRRLTLWGRT